MIKYIGITLLSACAAMYGIMCSERIKDAVNIRNAVLKLLYYIENGIQYGGMVKKNIYCTFNDECLERIGFMDLLRCEKLNEKNMDSGLYMLSNEDRRMLWSFFSRLGKNGSCQNEINNCKRFIAEFERAGEQQQQYLKSKIVLYKKLGIICSLATAVILL